MVGRFWQMAAGGAFVLAVACVLLIAMPSREVSSADPITFRVNYSANGLIVSIEVNQGGNWKPLKDVTGYKEKKLPLKESFGLAHFTTTHVLLGKDPCVEQGGVLWCWP